MMQIIPGILEKEWSEIEKKIELVKPFAPAIQIDLIDGKFADNTTFLDPEPFKKYTADTLFELHMMVEDPEKYIEPFAKAGFKRFIGHIEKMPDQAAFVARGQLWGEVGLALDVGTSPDAITVPFHDLDFLLVMTVKAGFSGQEFIASQLTICRDLKMRSELPIEIDGGVNASVIHDVKAAGVTRVVGTSYLFASADPKKQFDTITSVIAETQTS